MSFVARLSSEGMSGNPWWYSSGNTFYISGYGLPNCTCYAYGRYAEIRGKFADLPLGDAGTWWNTQVGFERSTMPELGAVACYASRTGSSSGHVAIVEVINNDGSIVTSNSAYNGTYFWTETVRPEDNYLSTWMTTNRDYYFQGFILNDAVTGRTANDYVISAICGCYRAESFLNPGLWSNRTIKPFDYIYDEDGNGAFGLAQWKNTDEDSLFLYNMSVYLQDRGYRTTDGDGQLAYLVWRDYWINSRETIGGYRTLAQFLRNNTFAHIDILVHDFIYNTLPSQIENEVECTAFATEYYNYIQLHKNDNPADYQWIFGNNILTESQMRNNAMCLYFWFINGEPEPIKPSKRKSMPLWMYLAY